VPKTSNSSNQQGTGSAGPIFCQEALGQQETFPSKIYPLRKFPLIQPRFSSSCLQVTSSSLQPSTPPPKHPSCTPLMWRLFGTLFPWCTRISLHSHVLCIRHDPAAKRLGSPALIEQWEDGGNEVRVSNPQAGAGISLHLPHAVPTFPVPRGFR